MSSQATSTVGRESIGSVQVVLDITGGMEELLQSVGSDEGETEVDGETVTIHRAHRATAAVATTVSVSSIASGSSFSASVDVSDFSAAAAISPHRDVILDELERLGEGSQGDRRARRARAQILSLDQSALDAISNLGSFTFGTTPARSALESLEGASASSSSANASTATGSTATATASSGGRSRHRRIRSRVLTGSQAVSIWSGEPTRGDDSQQTETGSK